MIKCCSNSSCPFYNKNDSVVRAGTYFRKSDSKHIQRFRCNECFKYFSSSTGTLEYGQNKRRVNKIIFELLSSGISMRRLAIICKVQRMTIKRKLEYLAKKAKLSQKEFLKQFEKYPVLKVQLDDLVTIEHTKLKPLTVTLAIEKSTRKILEFQVGRIPAFGHLAEKSRTKYGKRVNEHKKCLKKVFQNLQNIVDPKATFETDQHKLYPDFINKYFPESNHTTTKSSRGSVAGQGELKKVKFDPLFSINHTLAMLRANINRLFRRTWCTTKRPEMLANHIAIYVAFHNKILL